MHVLLLPSFYPDPEKPVSGIFFKEQALALLHHGIDVRVAYVEPRRLQSFSLGKVRDNHFQITISCEDGLETLRMRGWNPFAQTVPGALLWSMLTEQLVARYIELFGPPDLIHAHNSLWAGYAASNILKKQKVPYVLTEHSSNFLAGKIAAIAAPYVKRAFSNAEVVITVSKALSISMGKYYTNKEIVVVPNVVNTAFFHLPTVMPTELPFVFLGIAHLIEMKGFHLLIRAFADTYKDDYEVRLEIGGDGPKRAELENLCVQLGVDRQVTFLGALSQEDVRSAMWRAHGFVLPSFQETFGVVLIEAMSTGLPVISTRCGGPEEVITPESGLLVDKGDEVQLASALRQLRTIRYSRQLIRAHTESRYCREAVAGALENIYHDVKDKRQR